VSLGTISGRHFFWEHLSPPPPPPGALLPYTKKKNRVAGKWDLNSIATPTSFDIILYIH
jgi:hypothetical protein